MKIAFTSRGKGWDSKIDPRFGRAEGFLIFDDTKNELVWNDNSQNVNAAHGAGTQAAQHIINSEAKVLITGSVGPKAFDVLNMAKIEMFEGANDLTIKEALEKYKNNELSKAEK